MATPWPSVKQLLRFLRERDPRPRLLVVPKQLTKRRGIRVGRLVDLYTVVAVLRQGMRDSSIKARMMGSNPRLRGEAPIEAVHEGRAYEVMGVAKAFVTRR